MSVTNFSMPTYPESQIINPNPSDRPDLDTVISGLSIAEPTSLENQQRTRADFQELSQGYLNSLQGHESLKDNQRLFRRLPRELKHLRREEDSLDNIAYNHYATALYTLPNALIADYQLQITRGELPKEEYIQNLLRVAHWQHHAINSVIYDMAHPKAGLLREDAGGNSLKRNLYNTIIRLFPTESHSNDPIINSLLNLWVGVYGASLSLIHI
jgi:hypothetical protein